jgi:hypothetical protein
MINNKKIIEKLINLTKSNDIKWKIINKGDLYFESNTEKFICKYKISKYKIIDLVLTKYKSPSNTFFNVFVHIYYNQKNIFELNKRINSIYFQHEPLVYDLFAFIKYCNLLNNTDYFNTFFKSLNTEYINDLEIKTNRKIRVLKTKNDINIFLIKKNDSILIYTEKWFGG